MSKELSLPKGTTIPDHLVLIPDGNRRWARARGLPTLQGHRRGFEIAPKLFQTARHLGVHTVTCWCFSTENWNRSSQEVSYLMKLYEDFVDRNLREAMEEGVRIYHLGRLDRIPSSLKGKLQKAEKETKNNHKFVLNIALDYGGHDEVLRAFDRALRKIRQGDLGPADFMKKAGAYAKKYPYYLFKDFLDTQDQPHPYPDLIIRTSGEQRTSGMMSWQSAYAEFYWERSHFPDFTSEKLRRAIIDFSHRRRRFGGKDEGKKKIMVNPEKWADLEVSWRRFLSEGKDQEFQRVFNDWLIQVYGLSREAVCDLAPQFLSAISLGKEKNWKDAQQLLTEIYQTVTTKGQINFVPELVAEYEVSSWQISEKLSDCVDKKDLEEVLILLYGEIYQQSAWQLEQVVHDKAMALFERDLACQSQDKDLHWNKCRDFLQKSYSGLRELIS